MAYPSSIDSHSNPAGTNTLASPDHAGLHTSVNTSITAIENVLGTTAGTSVLKDFAAGNFPARINSSNVLQQAVSGTVNNSVIGTPAVTGGTINNATVGTPAITGGTTTSQIINSATIGTPTVNQALLQNRFVAKGEFDNGNSGTAKTIDWSNGDRQKLTVTANTTLTYSNAGAGQILNLSVDMNGTGGYTVTLPTSIWPGSVAGSFGTAANAKNELVVKYDGTNYRTQLAASFL